jgi:hypothetical protein
MELKNESSMPVPESSKRFTPKTINSGPLKIQFSPIRLVKGSKDMQ